ncbi:MAG: hypothetical protein EOM87_07090 [Clostridia bacterium]|nr:hypothetical protein [Clostridia bacterium]
MRIKIHPLFLIFTIIVTLTGGYLRLISALFAVMLHELSHARVAVSRGYNLSEITVMPYGAVLNLYGRLNKEDATAVLSAGVAANLCFVFFTVTLWWLAPSTYAYTLVFAEANLIIACVNMLPCAPLDGGRLLEYILTNKLAVKIISYSVAILSITMLSVLFVLSCFSTINFSFLIFAMFLLGYMLFPKLNYSLELFGIKKDIVNVREVIISEKTPLYKIMRKAEQANYAKFIVTDKKGRTLGCIEENNLFALAAKESADTQAGKLLKHR